MVGPMILSKTFERLHDREFERAIEAINPKPEDTLSASQKKLVLKRLKDVQRAKSIFGVLFSKKSV